MVPHIKGGFGARNDREDWIADLGELSTSANDYHWNDEDFGPDYGTFENALRQNLRSTLWYGREKERELIHKLNILQQDLNRLTKWEKLTQDKGETK